MKNITVYLVSCLLLSSCQKENRAVSYAEVVHKLMDMKSIAKLPLNGESSKMWSSYDRESRIGDSGEFISWGANIDGLRPQYIRKEGNQEVLAEMEGPGAIVRIWSASPRKGNVRIFLDGSNVPVLDLPFIDYFNNDTTLFQYPALVYETNAQGFNNYVPITYNKSCKIVADEGWGQYYHFNYISFPEEKNVESFNGKHGEKDVKALMKINDFFENKMGQSPYWDEKFELSRLNIEIPSGTEKTILKLNGKQAITSLKVNLKGQESEKMEEILRKTVIKIKWDGNEDPAVWSPLGDFFGSAPGWNNYKTIPMGMTDDFMYSYWYMPFENGAEISIQNEFSENLELEISIEHEKIKGNTADFGRFHAKWHRDLNQPGDDRWPDWTLLETEGKGRYVGTQLTVWNPKGGSCYLGHPGNWWWGEGDEKFFIDDEKFPSTFGTGTEDYFGYAWCNPAKFDRAFHSQSLNNGNMGYQPMNRWHIIESIPFQSSFKGYLEKYFPNDWPTQYSVVVYWYLDKNGRDPLQPVSVDERYGFETPYNVFRAKHAVEGEDFQVIENTGGWASGDVWANERLFDQVSGHKVFHWAADKNKENHLKLNFEWAEAGEFQILANVMKQKNGGVFGISLNGNKLKMVDGYSDKEPADIEMVSLGKVIISPGTQNLEISWHQKEDRGNILRIDCLKFEKI